MNQKLLNTSKRIFHVFLCSGEPGHIHPGTEIAKRGEYTCPTCDKPVHDITETELGQHYFAFVRQDLGLKP